MDFICFTGRGKKKVIKKLIIDPQLKHSSVREDLPSLHEALGSSPYRHFNTYHL